jgi:hypothetical protein
MGRVLDYMLAQRLSIAPLALMVGCTAGTIASPSTGGTGPTTNEGIPSAPTELKAFPHEGGIHTTWTDNGGDAEVALELERKSDGEFEKVATLVFGSVQYHDATPRPGGTYTYRVRAIGAGGASPYSNEATATAAPLPAGADAGTPAGDAGPSPPPPDAGMTSGDAGTPADSGAGVSFRNDVVPIFAASCGATNGGCHSRVMYAANVNMDCRGWLSLEDVPLGSINPSDGSPTGCPDRTLYQRLTELLTWMCDPPMRYVRPASGAASQIQQVIDGDPTGGGACNKAPNVPMERMPPVTQTAYSIDAASIRIIEEWISEGAQNN